MCVQENIERAKKDWELSHLQSMREEEDERLAVEEVDSSDIMLTYDRPDVANKVILRRQAETGCWEILSGSAPPSSTASTTSTAAARRQTGPPRQQQQRGRFSRTSSSAGLARKSISSKPRNKKVLPVVNAGSSSEEPVTPCARVSSIELANHSSAGDGSVSTPQTRPVSPVPRVLGTTASAFSRDDANLSSDQVNCVASQNECKPPFLGSVKARDSTAAAVGGGSTCSIALSCKSKLLKTHSPPTSDVNSTDSNAGGDFIGSRTRNRSGGTLGGSPPVGGERPSNHKYPTRHKTQSGPP